jgi:hypothetical protein
MHTPTSELATLVEASEDLHVDAMRTTRAGLDELVEHSRDRARRDIDPEEVDAYQARRRRLLGRSLTGAGAVAGGGLLASLVGWLAPPAGAAPAGRRMSVPADVQAAQTAASIENLAVAVYKQAAGLPFMKTIPDPAGATVTAFVTKTVAQHTEHAQAFNAAAKTLGGVVQNDVDKVVFDSVVTPALPTLKTPLDVVKFAAALEDVAAQTYAAETAAVSDLALRKTFAGIMGVEAQHRAVLLAAAALLQNDLAAQLKLPPDLAALPAAAGSVGFPDGFYKLDQARPADEGAVK